MDLLALPEDVLYEIISKLKLMDRLRMRRTCRAFAALIADSHFSSPHEQTITISAAFIEQHVFDTRDTWCKKEVKRTITSKIMIRISLGELWFKPIARDDLRAVQLLQGLFRSCKVEKVNIHLRGSVLSADFIRTLIGNFKIEELIVHGTEKNVSIAIDLFKYISTSKHCLVFNALPSRYILFSLPSLYHLKLTDVNDLDPNWVLSSSDLTHLLSMHKNITCAKSTVSVSAREFKELAEVISKSIDRSVTISVNNSESKNILTQFGITGKSKKFPIQRKDRLNTIYSNCIIDLHGKHYDKVVDLTLRHFGVKTPA